VPEWFTILITEDTPMTNHPILHSNLDAVSGTLVGYQAGNLNTTSLSNTLIGYLASQEPAGGAGIDVRGADVPHERVDPRRRRKRDRCGTAGRHG
jgi:hypothetical protein